MLLAASLQLKVKVMVFRYKPDVAVGVAGS
jgi:hypothetical protein